MRCLLVLAALFAALASAQFLSGTYTSDYGATGAPWYICIVGNQFYATYSRIGFVVGTISGNTMSGTFYEAGYSRDLNNNAGGYYGTIALTTDGSQTAPVITGTYVDQSGLSTPATGSWSINFSSAGTPAPELCWSSATPVTSGSISSTSSGSHWTNTTLASVWDFCATDTDNSIDSAYFFDDGPKSYTGAATGVCYLGGSVCTMIYIEKGEGAINDGQYLLRQVSANQFFAFGWTGYPNTRDDDWYNLADFGSYTWNSVATGGVCTRNDALYGSAASVGASAVLLAFAVLIAMF